MTEQNDTQAAKMSVAPMTLSELLAKELIVPEYQRPYSWKDEHVKNLLHSVTRAMRDESRLMLGTIIIHKNSAEQWELVDGQQRMVTLYMLVKCISMLETVVGGLGKSIFAHRESQENIRANHKMIAEWVERPGIDKQEMRRLLQDRTDLIVVTAPTLDEAFIFFNSQNDRGKRLNDYDLVKANHLRFIEHDDLQKRCAQSWERIERTGAEQLHPDCGTCTPTMKYLMQGILGRVRHSALKRAGTCNILKEFRCQRSESRESTYYYLSNYAQPPVFTRWRYHYGAQASEGGGLELVLKDIDADQGTRRLRFESDSKRYMPFQIPQSIEGGEQFFWFVEKYHALYNDLFVVPTRTIPSAFLEMMRMMREAGGQYVRKFFEAVMVFYFDKFGCSDPIVFMRTVMYLHFVVCDLQSRQRVQALSVAKYIREDYNPFALIHEASTPMFIIDKISEGVDDQKWYKKISKEGPAKRCRDSMLQLYDWLGKHVQAEAIARLAQQLKKSIVESKN